MNGVDPSAPDAAAGPLQAKPAAARAAAGAMAGKVPNPAPALRAFHRPRLWLGLGAVMVAAVTAGSLLPASELPPVPFDGFDKVQHLLGYAALSTYAVMLFARLRTQALCAIGLVALGVGLELAQAALTQSRQADPADALFNALGVLAGLAVTTTPLARLLQWLDARWR